MGGAAIDLLRIGGVGRIELGGDGELAAAEHALQAAARGVSGQCRQRRAGMLADVGGMSRGDHGGLSCGAAAAGAPVGPVCKATAAGTA